MLRRLKTASTSVNKLGNGITTDKQLAHALKDLPGFRGVYDRVDFFKHYPRMMPGDSVIVNLDPKYVNGGTHWVAVRISSDGQNILYKDSFGAPPPEAFYRNLGRIVLYGTNVFQSLDEQNCGKRSADFLVKLATASDDKKMFYQIA